ncbi:MAG: GrpB family protein [Gammaproteobacteria bacterium]|nr:GrpB family protein [Gammaproteobacteria bacterium]
MINKQFYQRTIKIVDYDPRWPKLFLQEQHLLLQTLENHDLIIEHIGSTTVPNLATKPVIDIMLGTHDLATAETLITPLTKIGYQYIAEFEKNNPDRRFLHKTDGKNTFHLHLTARNNDFWKKQLFFRNYLQANKTSMLAYQKLKRELAEKYQDNIVKYYTAKTDFICNILKNMTEEAGP